MRRPLAGRHRRHSNRVLFPHAALKGLILTFPMTGIGTGASAAAQPLSAGSFSHACDKLVAEPHNPACYIQALCHTATAYYSHQPACCSQTLCHILVKVSSTAGVLSLNSARRIGVIPTAESAQTTNDSCLQTTCTPAIKWAKLVRQLRTNRSTRPKQSMGTSRKSTCHEHRTRCAAASTQVRHTA